MSYETIYKITKRGRKKIKVSKAEQQCADILKNMGLFYKPQYHLPGFGRKRYDFYFEKDNGGKKYEFLLEVDGEQHFQYSSYMYRGKESRFKAQQTNDLKKTWVGISKGYCVIRIHHKDMGNLEDHLKNAIKNSNCLYVSNVDKYEVLLNREIPYKWCEKYRREKSFSKRLDKIS